MLVRGTATVEGGGALAPSMPRLTASASAARSHASLERERRPRTWKGTAGKDHSVARIRKEPGTQANAADADAASAPFAAPPLGRAVTMSSAPVVSVATSKGPGISRSAETASTAAPASTPLPPRAPCGAPWTTVCVPSRRVSSPSHTHGPSRGTRVESLSHRYEPRTARWSEGTSAQWPPAAQISTVRLYPMRGPRTRGAAAPAPAPAPAPAAKTGPASIDRRSRGSERSAGPSGRVRAGSTGTRTIVSFLSYGTPPSAAPRSESYGCTRMVPKRGRSA
jgi:hypothetical protein